MVRDQRVEGCRVHAKVDHPNAPLPTPGMLDADQEKVVSRSFTLSSEKLGIIAKIDVAEAIDGIVTPIDYKRGKRPHLPKGAYEPERIQVCLQALLLEEHGYQVTEGAIWYAESRERVRVVLDNTLRDVARNAAHDLRVIVSRAHIPPPLQDSPKCPRCALVSVCCPDEVRMLSGLDIVPRPISIELDDALPLIVQSQRARVSKRGDTLLVTDEDQGDIVARLNEVSDVALYGNVSITTPALSALFEREIPIAFHSHGGWLKGIAHGVGHRNVEVRTAQYRSSFDKDFCLRFSRSLVAAKIANQRTILRRNWRNDTSARKITLDRLHASKRSVNRASSLGALLGCEGDAARIYFRAFAKLLAPPETKSGTNDLAQFRFEVRNRRPPSDPVNAMLSFAYAMLVRQLTGVLAMVGLDPYRGFYHAPRYGRPALALDIMEPFRPIIADSVVLLTINSGEISAGDFVISTMGTALADVGRRRFIGAFERRLSLETTHPLFGYRLSMRRLLIMQARLLIRNLLGELPAYPHYLPR